MNDKEVSTISLVAHENSINRLYKVIRLLIIAIIVLCIAFAAYVGYDRYLDTTSINGVDVSQHSQDSGTNSFVGGDVVNDLPKN